ncbi:O-antigen ligase family protein [Candidatus Omnitrophota bacterium]
MVEVIIQTGVSAVFILSAFYFGGVSTLGNALISGMLSVLTIIVIVKTMMDNTRGCYNPVLLTGQGGIGLAFLLWIITLGISTFFSIYRPASVITFISFFSYFLIFILIVRYSEIKKITKLFHLLYILGCALSFYGIGMFFLSDTVLFSVVKQVYHNRLTATFINPNNFASFIGMLLPFAVYFIAIATRKIKIVCIFGTIIMVVALFLTFSLAACSSLIVAGIAMIIMHVYRKNRNPHKKEKMVSVLRKIKMPTLIIATVITVANIGFFMSMFMPPDTMPNMISAKSFSLWQRYTLYKGIIAMLSSSNAAFWNFQTIVVGGGLGCFRQLFHGVYGTYGISEFFHAHNEFLELLVETGIGGLGFFILIISLLLKNIARYLKKNTNRENNYFVISATAAVIFCLLHSLLDFPLRIPANGLLFFAIIGSLTVIVLPKKAETRKSIPKNRKEIFTKLGHSLSFVMNILFIGIIGIVFFLSVKNVIVENLIVRAEYYFSQKNYAAVERCFRLAVVLAPENAVIDRIYGEYCAYRAFSEEDDSRARPLYDRALHRYKKMIAKDPHLPEYYIRMAWLLMRLNLLEEAEEYFDQGIASNPFFLISYLERAHFYLYNNQLEKAAFDYIFFLDKIINIPHSQESKVGLLVRQLHQHMQNYPLHPALKEVYRRLAAYNAQFKQTGDT